MRELLLAALLAGTFAAGATELVVNGTFEQNGGLATNQFDGWSHSDRGNGSWYVQRGVGPVPDELVCSELNVPMPPSGSVAMTNADARGSRILYQDVAVPANAKTTLTFDLALSTKNEFNNPPTLDETVNNQQFRADLVDLSAPIDTTGSGVLLNLYATKTGDPKATPYTRITRDVSAFAGRTVRLRFAQVDRQFCMSAGIDNVSLDAVPIATIDEFTATKTSLSWHFTGSPTGHLYDLTSGTPQLLGDIPPSGTMGISPSSSAVYSLAVDNGPAETIVLPGSTPVTATIARDLRNATAIAIDPLTGDPIVIDSAVLRIGKHAVITRIAPQPGGGLAIDANGNIFVADTIDHQVRRVDRSGIVTVVAGSQDNPGDTDGTTAARFNGPVAIAIDPAGNLLVADANDHSLRRVTLQGEVTTIARFDFAPRGVAVTPSGTIYVSSDNDVRNAITGAIASSTGGAIAVDAAGNLVVAHAAGVAVTRDGRTFVVDKTTVRMTVPAAASQTTSTRRRTVGR